MYKKVSLPSVAAFQSSWNLLAITLVVGPNLPFGGLACGLVLVPLPSPGDLRLEQSLKFDFETSNNQAEYEAYWPT